MGTLLCPARTRSRFLLNPFARIRSYWDSQSRTGRELLTLGLTLAFGLILLPWLIWIAGQFVLGPYAGGSVWRFMGDFFGALGHGELPFWLIVLGPTVFVGLIRLMWLGLRNRDG